MEANGNAMPLLLGVAQRVQRRGRSLDILGFGSMIELALFPCHLEAFYLILHFPNDWFQNSFTFQLRAVNVQRSQQWASTDVTIGISDTPSGTFTREDDFGSRESFEINTDEGPVRLENHRLVVRCPALMLSGPGGVKIEVVRDGCRTIAGYFVCGWSQPAPLSEAERRAILSRPGAKRFLGIILQCKECSDRITIKESLSPADQTDQEEGSCWAVDAPDPWRCKCGASVIPTVYIKNGLFELFRRDTGKIEGRQIAVTRQYEKHALHTMLAEYEQLIHSEPSEEAVQTFLEEHPIFWSFLSPISILHKPPILTVCKADFGILTSSHVLYLVEIEKPQTRLMKRNSGLHSEFQAGLDQLRTWRVLVEDQRSAVLQCMGFKMDEVHDVRFMLIAGLARSSHDNAIHTLRRSPLEGEFCCFDELAA
ncbi:MAG: hypothetical protein JWN40_4350, partial [Phycisphaerales bacterium]|nr:hypothetical protein [Phycisphaerales bacterium]